MEFLKNLLSRWREQEDEPIEESNTASITEIKKEELPETIDVHPLPEWMEESNTQEVEELVAAIAAACVANSLPGKRYRIKKIQKIDEDWLIAGLAAISGVSQGKSNERYRIKSIKRVK